MTEAPERIWATCGREIEDGNLWVDDEGAEYIRADLVDPAAIREAALREAYEEAYEVWEYGGAGPRICARILALIQVSASQNDKKEDTTNDQPE